MYGLEDLDTAFPRTDSNKLMLTFANGASKSVLTNMDILEYDQTYHGQEIRMSYYKNSPGVEISRLINIHCQ